MKSNVHGLLGVDVLTIPLFMLLEVSICSVSLNIAQMLHAYQYSK